MFVLEICPLFYGDAGVLRRVPTWETCTPPLHNPEDGGKKGFGGSGNCGRNKLHLAAPGCRRVAQSLLMQSLELGKVQRRNVGSAAKGPPQGVAMAAS